MLYPCRLKSRTEKAEEKEAAEISFSYSLLDSFIDGAFPALLADYENELFMIENEDVFQIADDLEKRFSR